MAKKIYVITGSEDGILGVASNIKSAYRMASKYVLSGCDSNINKPYLLSYRKVVDEFKGSYWCSVTGGRASFGDAEIRLEFLVSK